jgi:hypothetical protein
MPDSAESMFKWASVRQIGSVEGFSFVVIRLHF